MAEDLIIQFDHIKKNFDAVQALKDVSFSIRRGECHAILGENGAGKSTLMHMLAGMYQPDGGKIFVEGQEARITSPQASDGYGISIVYQELKLCPNLDAAENIFLGIMPSRAGFIKRGNIYKETKEILDSFGVDIDITVPVKKLGPAQMQLIEIAKAIQKNANIMILDEPTSSLTAAEADTLFAILDKLKAEGKTLIFISHRMNEIFAMADRITVMRDGMYLGTFDAADITEDQLVRMIAGDKCFNELYAEGEEDTDAGPGEEKVALELCGINCGKYVRDVSLKLYEGEILGLYGLQGSGRTELVETVFGLYGKVDGKVVVHGRPVEIKSPRDAISSGIGLLTEDRKNRGIFSLMDIRENIAVIHQKSITRAGGFIDNKKVDRISGQYTEELSVKTDSIRQKIVNLSGGNQQKVVLARMLSMDPRIILADEPTRGVDVGAKAEIFAILKKLRKQGRSVILISSELAEVVRESDRVLVLRNGEIVGEVKSRSGREEKILNYAFNGRE